MEIELGDLVQVVRYFNDSPTNSYALEISDENFHYVVGIKIGYVKKLTRSGSNIMYRIYSIKEPNGPCLCGTFYKEELEIIKKVS